MKACLDEDRRQKHRLQVILLGSASLLVQKGARESLAGRFEQHFCPHWTWPGREFLSIRKRPDEWGWLVENAVGGYLLNQMPSHSVYYWRQGHHEVDFVLQHGNRVLGLEVKSGRPGSAAGLAAFQMQFPKAKIIRVGMGGIPLEQFFSSPPTDWF